MVVPFSEGAGQKDASSKMEADWMEDHSFTKGPSDGGRLRSVVLTHCRLRYNEHLGRCRWVWDSRNQKEATLLICYMALGGRP